MKTLIIILALCLSAFADTDPAGTGTLTGIVVEIEDNGDVVLCATKIKGKFYDVDAHVYIVLRGIPVTHKFFLEEGFACFALQTADTAQIHKGYRPYPVFRYIRR